MFSALRTPSTALYLPAGGRRCCGLRRRPARPRAAPRRTAASQAQGGDDKYWSQIKGAREQQLAATDLLAKLLQAPDPKAVAQQHLGSLTEQFFQIASTYMTMAQKEGETVVYEQMKAALTAALEVKQATLRPEIQLLNKLLAADGALAWKQVLNTKEAGEQLAMNDGYFFQLLDRMAQDVARQPDHPQKAPLQQKLAAIRQEATARLPPKK